MEYFRVPAKLTILCGNSYRGGGTVGVRIQLEKKTEKNPIFFEIPCVKYKKIFYFWEKKYFFRNEQKNVKIMWFLNNIVLNMA